MAELKTRPTKAGVAAFLADVDLAVLKEIIGKSVEAMAKKRIDT